MHSQALDGFLPWTLLVGITRSLSQSQTGLKWHSAGLRLEGGGGINTLSNYTQISKVSQAMPHWELFKTLNFSYFRNKTNCPITAEAYQGRGKPNEGSHGSKWGHLLMSLK